MVNLKMILLSNTIITFIDTLLDHNEKDADVQFIRMHCGMQSLQRKLPLFITNRKHEVIFLLINLFHLNKYMSLMQAVHSGKIYMRHLFHFGHLRCC